MDEEVKDQDFRASYKETLGCHIIIIEQFDVRNPKKPFWRTVTNLFCLDKRIADNLVNSINLWGH